MKPVTTNLLVACATSLLLSACVADPGAPTEISDEPIVAASSSVPWAILMCRFHDYATSTPARDKPWFESFFARTTAGHSSLGDFIFDQSYGAVNLQGSTATAGWLTMTASTTASRQDQEQSCIDAAAAAGFDFAKYTHVAFMFNESGSTVQVGGGWTWGGPQTLNLYTKNSAGQRVTYQQTVGATALDLAAWQLSVGGQEILHGMGLVQHAWSRNPDREYYDRWDVMGAPFVLQGDWGSFPNDCSNTTCNKGTSLSAPYRDLMGWLPASRIYTYGTPSASSQDRTWRTVTLAALDRIDRTNPLMVKVPLETADHYLTIELRTKTGWDAGIPRNAVVVKEMRPNHITYMNNFPQGDSFGVGEAYADAATNLHVSVDAIDAAAGTATITIGPEPASWRSGLAPDAIVGGTDNNGMPLYVCHASLAGGVLPGKIRADWSGCDIGNGGVESTVTTFQTLTPTWQHASGGAVPANAASYGNEAPTSGQLFGTPLYICRASYGNAIHTGKVRPGYDGCYLPYGGQEIHVASYDVLVNASGPIGPQIANVLPLKMLAISNAPPPVNAIVGAQQPDASLVYPCLAAFQGGLHPGKTQKSWSSCDISWGGGEYFVPSYSVLVPQFTAAPLNWSTPAYVAGADAGGASQGVCRASYASGVQVGRLTNGGCSFGYGGREVVLATGFDALAVYHPVLN